ncbi:MAG: hypothetical protein JO153_01605 [Solirubrobacterales bacterium]|nr:hypothetical protein [Solirubrobacterales bacterium]
MLSMRHGVIVALTVGTLIGGMASATIISATERSAPTPAAHVAHNYEASSAT